MWWRLTRLGVITRRKVQLQICAYMQKNKKEKKRTLSDEENSAIAAVH